MKIWQWIKLNKVFVAVLIIGGFLVIKPNRIFPQTMSLSRSEGFSGGGMATSEIAYDSAGSNASFGMAKMMPSSTSYPTPEIAPTASTERMVISSSNISLQVKDVADSIKNILDITEKAKGFMVSNNTQKPMGNAYGSITIRIPSDQLQNVLDSFKKLAVQVVSENIEGRDVTDQYEDSQAKLRTLDSTKAKLEGLLDKSEKVPDLLQVQRELINVQTQIDQIKGRQKYLEESAKLAKVTISLSTDELALPYTPDEVWRPQLVFKNAVRDLVRTMRMVANRLIWLVVFAPVWIVGIVVLAIVWKVWNKVSKKNDN